MRFLSVLLATLVAAKLHNRILMVLVLTISTFVTAAADCSSNFCESVLKDGFLTLRYKLNEPDDTITMEVTYEGDAWVGLAFSDASESMAGSIAVMASSEVSPQKYQLIAPTFPVESAFELMSPEEQTLVDASCDLIDGQTVLKFTTQLLADETPFAISLGENHLLWAYGRSPTIGYHSNRSPFTLNLAKAIDDSDVETLGTVIPTASPADGEMKVGDDICITGYIMDSYCIDLGHFLDNDDTVTLREPEEHSFHCLLDLPVCYNSGFNVLGEKDHKLDCIVLDIGLMTRKPNVQSDTHYTCDTCSGGASDAVAGYRATVKGTVKEMGDGTKSVTGQPLLSNIQMLDASVVCESPAPQTVCLSMDDVEQAPAQVPEPVEEPEPVEKTEEPEPEPCSLDFCVELSVSYLLAYTVNGDGTITMELTYDGNGWVGIGFSENGMMVGSDAVIGSTDVGIPQKYRLTALSVDTDTAIQLMSPEEQTLTDATVEFKDGQTVMKFTKIMKEPNQIEISMGKNNMLGAYGARPTIGLHARKMNFSINLSSGAAEEKAIPFMSAWLAHGIIAFIAWGVLVPTAVQSAIMRSLFKGPTWFKLHQNINATAMALTVVVFAIGVAVTSKEGAVHFENSHERMGLAMFIIAVLQVLDGAKRPHAPGSGEEKTLSRKAWEIGHRLGGAALLACGFWQMDSGIKLYAIKFNGAGSSQENSVILGYWVWIGFVVAMLVIGGVYFKLLRSELKSVDQNDDGSKEEQVNTTAHISREVDEEADA
ncbi:cytochrome b561 and DOMON domain-containing protein [Skeletonema marinoi]|uniref:Cytochrome b561 and DOMON domain-containing protein n=1 Tax=Skeletonema marinoi TaxID=267567 RepID=A0AAD8Y1U8_9STRA|nr:cytochrome b561 and DOMON domain-containing protein [Skeletonema marinoi]